MPPRYAYWTIIAGGLPTAFRTTEREELLPTFRRIKQKHPDAELKYFARGRLWQSPDEARVEAEARRAAAAERHGARGGTSRGRDWRPGGEHQDPRQKFKDAKKVRNQDRRQERFDRRHKSGAAPPPGGAPARPAPRASPFEWRNRGPRTGKETAQRKPGTPSDRPWSDRGPRTSRPPASGDRPWRDRGPTSGKPGAQRKPDWRKTEERRKPKAQGDRSWRDHPPKGNRPGEPYRGKPKAGDDRKPAPPKARGSYRAPKASGARKPLARPRSSGLPHRDRNQRGPAKDRRRR